MTGPSRIDPTSADPFVNRPVSRGEWLALLFIVFSGLLLRGFDPVRLSVEHFDEGVYASNWFCRPPGLPEGVFPQQHLYAPPLLPELCFWTLFASGSNPRVVMWINVIAGTLMIPLVWRLARRWFGSIAGFAAATLCATSDLHLALSRSALTDVLLCLFLTAGVDAGMRAILTGSRGTIVLAGILAGLAWWTKYNGWLTLAITGAGLAGWITFARPRQSARSTLVIRWGATVAIATIVWSPVWFGLQKFGGYATVSTNHSRYMVGLTGWCESFFTQWERLQWFESWLGWAALALLPAVLLFIKEAIPNVSVSPGRVALRVATLVMLLASVSFLGGVTGGLILTSFVAAGVAAWRTWHSPPAIQTSTSRDLDASSVHPLTIWTTLAWITGLAVAVPLYTPYPRLALPLICGSWFGVAFAAQLLVNRQCSRAWSVISTSNLPVLFASLLFVLGIIGGRFPRTALPNVAWQDRRGVERLAQDAVAAAAENFVATPQPRQQQVDAILYIFAEPSLFYHLSALPQTNSFRFIPQPVGDHSVLHPNSSQSQLATFVIVGPHASAVPSDAEPFEQARESGGLTLVREFQVPVSDLVQLDDRLPVSSSETAEYLLYRVASPTR